MGNNNATASLTEEESSKLETNGMSPLESVSVENTKEEAGEDKDGDKEKESFPDGGKGGPEAKPQSKELVEDPKVKNVEEEVHQRGLESSVIETDEQLQKQTSVAQGVETVTEVEEQQFSMITTESGDEEKPCVIDEIVFVSPTLYETVESEEEKMIDESQEEIIHAEEVAKLDQETGLEQRTGFAENEPRDILNLENRLDEVTNEGNVDQVICKLGSQLQESNPIQATCLEVYMEDRDLEIGREKSLKRMSRCRSLPVSRVTGDSLVQQFVSEVAFPSRNKMGLEEANTSETLLVPSVGSITECNKDAELEMRSPSSGSDLRIKERSDELIEKTPLLCQDKSDTYEATIDVEEKTVMLKRSESEKIRGIEMSLGFSKKHSERSEANDGFKETKGSGDNLLDKKSLSGGRVRKRSKSSLLRTCLCCATAMN